MDNIKEDFEVNDELDVSYNPPILEDDNFLIDEEEIEKLINPFEENPTSYAYKYWEHYMQLQNKEHIQRIYNIGKITKEEFITITGEEPQDKVKPNGTILNNLVKTDSLEVTTGEQDFAIFINQMDTMHLSNTTEIQDLTMFELQMLVFSLESRITELEKELGGNK